jgi:NAD(P)-dependent dehydrogenase (short-subunit alcohol dehydrogenase family)
MKDFAGKAAFITGGAGGIGLAMARVFGQRGMKVAIADVEADACARAVETLRREGITAIGITCDVSDHEALAATMPAYPVQAGSRLLGRPIGTG